MNTTSAFVRHALSTRFDNLPDAACQSAKTFILDTIGVGVAGANAPHADDLFRAVTAWGTGDGAHVYGRREKLTPAGAAFMNGFQIHGQEFDCVHEPAVVHPMATIFAALLADAEASGAVSGRDFIAAIAVAVDVAAGLGVAAKSGIRFFRPATAGIFGATLGIARLRGFDEQQALNALGYALGFASGTMQAHVEGKPALPVQIGNAARGAVAACDIAGVGLPGPNDVFDGPFGYLPLFETTADLAPVIQTLGDVWRITEVSHKPFPTGRAAHGGIVAMQQLRRQGLTAQNLKRLTLTAPPLIHRLVGRPYQENMSTNYARLCFPYCGAVTLLRGSVDLNDFTPDHLRDPVIATISQRISVEDDGSDEPAAFTPQYAVAELHDGRVLNADVSRLYGAPGDPMSRDAQLAKFRQCISYGRDAEECDRADAMIAFVENLESQADMAGLARLASGL